MKIVIVGTGYVGLVTGVCFAEVGVDTVCVDIDKDKIDKLKKGLSPIYEPGLDELITKNLEKGRISFDTDLANVIDGAEMVFIAVGTPPDEDGSADLKYVLDVAHSIGCYMNDYLVVVTKSTVPVGTAQKVKEAISYELDKRGVDIEFDVASNPEFLKEGDAINDFMRPDRIVIGVESDRAQEIFQRLYKPFTLNGHPLIFMDIPSAEMTKYAANAMLATRISFMNDIANLCEILGADVNMVRLGIGSDPRIGNKFLYPGIGFGGSCFPKDVKALIKSGLENQYPLRLLQAVENINEDQKSILVKKLIKFYNGDISDKKIVLWGLSFKPNTDDMREAPSLVIIDKLLEKNAKVIAYDPVSIDEAKRRLGDKIEYANDMYEPLNDADALLLVTEWTEFRLPDWDLVKKLMKTPLVLDGRNIYDAREMKQKGFFYYCIGVRTY
ncbi:MAG: UDP-glucose/GDP-mannose dehydrogenase family protein [Bacteroidales bacterium]|nr:UDP-glucose/GDP-mannose dehydrogenase family protein [Bacteroidales bacterium]MDI9576482.1 UDP-glucose/GDP-mannose dehydrogenase family protein [Bacteroidota bacterium]HPZ74494.1 UDP-glucose/GDP-mannose dehydrogenase family protein [Candidatus Pacearchaeota archaeon]MDD3755360.1 UDP-glucose/GDP-mannose dehydrogenase family protein [Bacteroidales bacterium]MDY0401424.1 UDP-glucose/GDP-mannose dehydrogenase family protein [Bacteroidales bacterium]